MKKKTKAKKKPVIINGKMYKHGYKDRASKNIATIVVECDKDMKQEYIKLCKKHGISMNKHVVYLIKKATNIDVSCWNYKL